MKRLFTSALAMVMLLPLVLAALTGLTLCCRNSSESQDPWRETALAAACLQANVGGSRPFLSSAVLQPEDRYVVGFAPGTHAEDLLDGLSHICLASPEQQVYAVTLSDPEGFARACGEALLYCEKDHVLHTADLPEDPGLSGQNAYTQIDLFSAWEETAWEDAETKQDILVAVLDTGVDRLHEELAEAKLLEGYDATTDRVGVQDDPDGHGTAVIGLIAATAGNGKGFAGVAYGVSILPIRVTAGANVIYSSDLIRGIRFAADAGARILNLSLGGYTYSAAEYDAVCYALERGCILIAAAGNDGKNEQGFHDVYPASYEGVISVGSCTPEGTRSAFSQKNDSVDLLAPGEGLTLLRAGGTGSNAYCRDSGSSYSAAIVTGVTALAITFLDEGIPFAGEQVVSLLAAGRPRSLAGNGHGVINALTAVREVNTPLITGVEPNATYSEKIVIRFNRGTATLDGEDFPSGGSVLRNGNHTLVVTQGEFSKQIFFRVRYKPATYELKRDADGVRISYTGGSATLDGRPYESDAEITASGWHLFRLTDPVGDVISYSFYHDPLLPTVSGVEDGGSYDRPVLLTVAGAGEALLDGEVIEGSAFVTADGEHTLLLRNGTESRTLQFTLHTGVKEWENAVSRCGVFTLPGASWYAVYGEMLAGVRVYDRESGAYVAFADTGEVKGYAFDAEGRLLVFGKWKLSVLDPALLAEGNALLASYTLPSECFAYANGQVYCLLGGMLQTVSLADGSLQPVLETDADELYTDGSLLWLYSSKENRMDRFDGQEVTSARLAFPAQEKRKLVWGELLFCGGLALRGETLSVAFSFDGYALSCDGARLYTTDGVYRLADGVRIGRFDRTLSCVYETEEGAYLCGRNGGIRFYPAAQETERFYAPEPTRLIQERERVDSYTDLYRLYGAGKTALLAADGDRFGALPEGGRTLLLFYENGQTGSYALPFDPSGLTLAGGQTCVWSEPNGLLWLDGRVYSLGLPIRNAFYAEQTWQLLAGGRLYRLEGETFVPTELTASEACGLGEGVCLLSGGRLTLRVGGETVSVSCHASRLQTDGTYAVADKTVYRMSDGEVLATLPSVPSALCDGAALCAEGLYLLQTGERIGGLQVTDCRFGALATGCGVVLCTDGVLSVSGYAYPVWEMPVLSGLPENGLLSVKGNPSFDRGIGYLDGERFYSGMTVSEPGEHVLSLILPYGILWDYPFTVAPALEGIFFPSETYRMSAGESGLLRVQYEPHGTQTVPVVFSCEGDCILLSPDGNIEALRDGEATVYAQTADGRFTASCRVIVTPSLIRFDPNSGYRIDRESALLLDVPAGMRVDALSAQLVAEGELSLVASTRYIGTGTELSLHSSYGEELDRLTVVVRGDLDGDGFVTLQDLLLLERGLESGFSDALQALAADLNQSGSATDRDANLLRDTLLFTANAASHAVPPVGEETRLSLLLPEQVLCGEILRITVYLQDGISCDGASARLYYDTSLLQYLSAESYSWKTDVREGNRWVSLLSTCPDDREPTGETVPLVTLRFRVLADTQDRVGTLLLRDGCLLFKQQAIGQERLQLELQPEQRVYGEISLTIPGLSFSAEQTEYDVSVPGGTPALSYRATYPEDCSLTVSENVFDREDRLDVTFRFRMADGQTRVYTVHAHRGKRIPAGKVSSLASLSVAGVPFLFDPEVTTYELTVPYEVGSLQLQWETTDPNATVTIGSTSLEAGKVNTLTLIVTAENGEQTTYTLQVLRLEKENKDTGTGKPKSDRGGWLWIIPISLTVVGGTGIFLWARRDRKRKTTQEQQEDLSE